MTTTIPTILCRFSGVLLSAAALVAGSGAARASESTTAAEQRLHSGVSLIEQRRLYAARCASCHGETGTGTAKARVDFSAAQALVTLSREAILESLEDGHGGRLEEPLGAEQRERVTAYVRNYLMLPAPAADTDIGRTIYSQTCSVCHGDRGNAASWAKYSLDPAPADFTAHGLGELSRKEMINAVTFGEDGTAMMPFAVQLTREEIAATVDYIRAAFMPEQGGDHGHDHGGDHAASGSSGGHGDHETHAAAGHDGHGQAEAAAGHGGHDAAHGGHEAESAAAHGGHDDGHGHDAHAGHGQGDAEVAVADARPGHGEAGHNHAEDHKGEEHDMSAPFPHGLIGDAALGRTFYNNNCAECHGRKGDGEGPRAYFMITKPENFTSREARAELNREELFDYISHGVVGTTMPAWRTVLSNQQIANVGEYVFRAFIRPEKYGNIAAEAPGWSPAGGSDAAAGAKKN